MTAYCGNAHSQVAEWIGPEPARDLRRAFERRIPPIEKHQSHAIPGRKRDNFSGRKGTPISRRGGNHVPQLCVDPVLLIDRGSGAVHNVHIQDVDRRSLFFKGIGGWDGSVESQFTPRKPTAIVYVNYGEEP